MKRSLVFLALFVGLAAFAQESASPRLPADPAQILGFSPAQLIASYGPPTRVFALRGAEPWQDDVVFDYLSFSAFIFMDRVWQLRIAADYPEPILGFHPSASLERIEASLGLPATREPGNYEWALPGRGWPVRLRAVHDEHGAVRELYLYRADF
ncbi:MAG TPA: hypothetical protein DCG47_06955 [Spirochaetaceae bacterium]|jgi:hypothetical protein|nr:hypothetical protein [Spirochaetaceae bacterium]